MEKDYTPLDIDTFKKKYSNQSKGNIFFIVIAILTIIVLGLLVVILMQKQGA